MQDCSLETLIEADKISERVAELAEAISCDYEGRTPLILCVLKGAVVFLADLVRHLRIAVEIDFVAASSYRKEQSKGEVELSSTFAGSIRGKDVIIVEDIIDTGLTCRALCDYLAAQDPASLRICALLDKPSRRQVESISPDYVGFAIPDKFVVGYGLDYEGRYRELSDIRIFAA